MIIGIDGNEANIVQRVGVGQYAYNLLTELSKIKSSHQYHIYLKNPPLADLPPASSHWHYHVFGPQKLWTRFALPLYLFTRSPHLDYFYSPSHYSPLFSPCPTIPTIHDLGYLQTPKEFTSKDFYQLTHWTKESLDKAHHICAVSEFTKQEITRIYGISPHKISIVYNGFTPPPSIDSPPLVSPPYFLYLGTLKPNKNLPFLINSFAQYHRQHPSIKLVIAGKKGWLYQTIFATVLEQGIESSVVFTDYITEVQKWSLLQHALALVIPSLYEGFGIPAIESQRLGTPVIASNIPVFQEILGQSAILIDPTRPTELVDAFAQVQKTTTRRRLITAGHHHSRSYTWANSANSLHHLFDRL